MAEESKPIDGKLVEEDTKGKGKAAAIESDDEEVDDVDTGADAAVAGTPSAGGKKKKSKRKKLKDALTGKSSGGDPADKEAEIHKALEGLSPEQVSQLLELNPALANEIKNASGGSSDPNSAIEALKRMHLQDIMTGLAASGKNAKDMGAYKFWSTQPVPKFGENKDPKLPDGPIRAQKLQDVPKEPAPLTEGFEWDTINLENPEELKEVWELLNGHYVEDDEAMFRFNYSSSILKWSVHRCTSYCRSPSLTHRTVGP
jgi:glycylpeptide N-tetradecanoyltransferase